jgi:hypothetical protein
LPPLPIKEKCTQSYWVLGKWPLFP